MPAATAVKAAVPPPIRRAARWGLLRARRTIFGITQAGERWGPKIVSAGLQRWIPGLSRRIKIGPATTVAVITTCGNRLTYLKRSLPLLLSQSRKAYEVIVSVYADREGCASYVKETFPSEIRSGRLKVIDTPAQTFNKARALNIGVEQSGADFLLLVDVDCQLSSNDAVEQMIRRFNLAACQLASLSHWGQILVARQEFLVLGGYDVTLGDKWAPDDLDFLCRHIAHFGGRYLCFSKEYTFAIDSTGSGHTISRRDAARPEWIRHDASEERGVDWKQYNQAKFYQRIGGLKETKEEHFAATLRYFGEHSPLIPPMWSEQPDLLSRGDRDARIASRSF